eukprot:jgi/Tetstr1/442406/TSEL_030532.t1
MLNSTSTCSRVGVPLPRGRVPVPRARPVGRRCALVTRAVGEAKQGKVEVDKESGLAKGLKWDGANLRWVKSDTAYFQAVVQPKAGAAYTVWPVVHTVLTQNKLKSITVEQAAKEVKSGKAILVDVRDPFSFARNHAEGSVNVPLFRGVQGNTAFDNVKKLVMAGFAMRATERNPEFQQDAIATLPKNKKIIVSCAIGGSLVTTRTGNKGKVYKDPERAFGRESRSLKACYELYQAGYKNIVHLEGGIQQWRYQGYPVESD